MVSVGLGDNQGQGEQTRQPYASSSQSRLKTISPNDLSRNPPLNQWRKAEKQVMNVLTMTYLAGNCGTIKENQFLEASCWLI